jgi:hypothetical protein
VTIGQVLCLRFARFAPYFLSRYLSILFTIISHSARERSTAEQRETLPAPPETEGKCTHWCIPY